MKIIVMSKYKESELFARALLDVGQDVQILRLDANLKDKHCIVYDEMNINNKIVIVDGAETSYIAQRGYINNALFFYLNLNKNEQESEFVKTQDYFTIEVKNAEDKTRDDWKKAADVFIRQISESPDCSSHI